MPSSMQIHELLAPLCTYDATFLATDLPKNGIYIFYEKGQVYRHNDQFRDRIVRVGTHRVDNRLRKRLRTHYKGNSGSSVFRRHLGVALMEAGVIDRALVVQHMDKGMKHPPLLEKAITQRLVENFRFSVVRIDSQQDRLRLEAGLIASLAFDPERKPSGDWLGRKSPVIAISESGLWNVNHVKGLPLSPEDFAFLRDAVSGHHSCSEVSLPLTPA